MLDQNRVFGQKSKFVLKIEILVKNLNWVKNRNFYQKSKFGSKTEILIKNRNSAENQ